ncbi:MAG: translation elongation factor Ts, partial [Caulobacteraceae bacterium]
VGENMVLRRFARFTIERGAVGAYVHGAAAGAADLGRIGVIVAVDGEGDQAILRELARNIALHVAASAPLSVAVEDLDPAAVERERAIFSEQAVASGKPPAVVERMVEGRLRKFYEEAVLLKQAYVKNPDQTIEQLIAAESKASGGAASVKGFVRFALGEGVERGGSDFASEVAALTGA